MASKNGKTNRLLETTMTSQQDFAALSEGEKIVRTYKCTQLKQIFAKPTIGYLTITNKRLVYHSESKKVGTENAILSEIPLEDIGGINSTIGNSLNIIYFLMISIGLYIATLILTEILPDFLVGWWGSILLSLPFLAGLLFEKQIISPDIGKKIIDNLEGTAVQDVFKNADTKIIMKVFKILFFIGFPLLAWNLSRQVPFFGWFILLGAYFLMYTMIFGKSRSFGLQILSKRAGSSSIAIHGNTLMALFNPSNTAAKTMNAAPTEESGTIVKEIGALITDIQQMGDLGIEKWTRT
jgi:hypothetical protein